MSRRPVLGLCLSVLVLVPMIVSGAGTAAAAPAGSSDAALAGCSLVGADASMVPAFIIGVGDIPLAYYASMSAAFTGDCTAASIVGEWVPTGVGSPLPCINQPTLVRSGDYMYANCFTEPFLVWGSAQFIAVASINGVALQAHVAECTVVVRSDGGLCELNPIV